MEEKIRNFNCVKMKHSGAKKVQDKIKNMTIEEELMFWKKGTEELRNKQKTLKIETTEEITLSCH
jgi:hypothetical protein